MGKNIYVASSWRNERQESVVKYLRACGHTVYDFKCPKTGGGFYWADVDPDWQSWSLSESYLKCKTDDKAIQGFINDAAAIRDCDVLVMVLPCGKSAHIEAGVAIGLGKEVVILGDDLPIEADLMYSYASFVTSKLTHLGNYLGLSGGPTDPLLSSFGYPDSCFGEIKTQLLPNWRTFVTNTRVKRTESTEDTLPDPTVPCTRCGVHTSNVHSQICEGCWSEHMDERT